MKEKLKIFVGIVIAIALILAMGALVYNRVRANSEEVVNPVATFEIKDYGSVKVELYPEYAPNTVSNIIALIEAGYYKDKVLYGKDDICVYMARNAEEDAEGPKVSTIDSSIEPDSEGDYEYTIKGEFVANGFERNTLRHEKGMLSLNRADYSSYGLSEEGYNSGNAQFSVLMSDNSSLNGMYCGFGKVVEGFDIIEKIYNEVAIAETETEQTEERAIQKFAAMPVIANATIEKFGVNYEKPEIQKAFDIQAYMNELYGSYYSN